MYISIIIPTKNRIANLKRLLDDVLETNLSALRDIIVVYDGEIKLNQLSRYENRFKHNKITLSLIRGSGRGLTSARIIGIKKSRGNILAFIDDDVRIYEKEIFDKIIKNFKRDQNLKLLGILSRREDLPFKLFNIARCIFIQNNPVKNFDVLVTGRNGGYINVQKKGLINTEWVSGYFMCVDRSILGNTSFDENLVKYSFGEDFLFSNLVRKRYGENSVRLLVDCKVNHAEIPSARINQIERICMEHSYRMYICHRLDIIPKNVFLKILWMGLIFWSAVGDSLLKPLSIAKHEKNIYILLSESYYHLYYGSIALINICHLNEDPNYLLKRVWSDKNEI